MNSNPYIKLKIGRHDLQNVLILLIFFFCSLNVFQIYNKTFFFIFEVLLFFSLCVSRKILYVTKDKHLNLIYVALFITCIFSLFSNLPYEYKRASLRNTIFFSLSYFIFSYVFNLESNNKFRLYLKVTKIIKFMCNLQLLWCILQFVLFRLFSIDVNNLIFNKYLGMVEVASAYKFGSLLPSGFNWHPAVMAPIIALAFFLNSSLVWKIISLATAILSGNATCMIVAVLCVFFSVCLVVINKQINKKVFIILVITILILFMFLLFTGFWKTVVDSVSYLFDRIVGQNVDVNSSNAHKMYYTEYPNVISHSSLLQLVFGYGKGTSGYPFTLLYHYQIDMKSWSVECDFVDILISRGVVGFVIYYTYLFKFIHSGRKVNPCYSLMLITIVLAGITYQVQYDWVFIIEILMCSMIRDGFDCFNYKDMEVNCYG